MGRIAIAVALLTTATWAQAPTYPSSHAPYATAATEFLALPAVAPPRCASPPERVVACWPNDI